MANQSVSPPDEEMASRRSQQGTPNSIIGLLGQMKKTTGLNETIMGSFDRCRKTTAF
jgi:hypothetical protein